MTRWIMLLVPLVLACEGGVDTSDTGSEPSDTGADSGETGIDSGDSGTPVPLAGYGEITGSCGVLDDTEWLSANPFVFFEEVTFSTAYTSTLLSADGQEVIADGNLGGSSLESEALAMDLLYRCELAALLATEGEVVYDVEGKKIDLVVAIDGRRIGVSVTRAVGYPRDAAYTVQQAETLLSDKLSDILKSTANVSDADAWERQILFVLAYSPAHAASLQSAWEGSQITAMERADTILLVATTNGSDGFVYGDSTP